MMRFSNNNFLIFFNDKETASQVSEIIRKKYPEDKNNLIESVHELSDALKLLKEHWKKKIFFDIIIVDLRIPLKIRKEFIKTATGKQAVPDCILDTNNIELTNEDKKFINKFKMSLIPDINELTLFSLLENIFEKRFNEKKYNLINRIDDIVSLRIDSQEILARIVKITLDYLNQKICWISLVDYETRKLKVGSVTGFGKYEEQYKNAFDISLSEKSVTTECIKRKKQKQYRDVLDENCPFKYKDFAKKIGLKSILLTPIFGKDEDQPDKVVATFNLYTDYYHEFQEDERELARIIASKIAVVLSMKGVYGEERDQTRKKLELIEKVAAEINKNVSDYKKVFKTIVDEGINLVHAHRGCIKLYDIDRDYISREYPRFCENIPYANERLREPDITSHVIKEQKPVIIPDIHKCEFKDPTLKYVNYGSRISVPLWSSANVIGVLTAEHNEKNYFTEEHLRLFEALAKHAVIAIENTKRYKQLQKRLQSQLIIGKLIKETSKLKAIEDEKKRKKYQKDQLDAIIRRSIEGAVKVFDAQSGFVVLAGFMSNYAIRNPKWQFGLDNIDLPQLEIGVIKKGKVVFKGTNCITGKVIAEGKLYNCGNVKDDPFYLRQKESEKTGSEIIVPLKFQNQTIGAFSLNSSKENAFSGIDEEILESISGQMALLIKHFGYLNALIDLSKPFKKIDDIEQLYVEIVKKTLEILDTKVSYLRVLDKNELIVKGSTGIDDEISLPMKIGEGISGKVAKKCIPKIKSNIQDPSCEYKYKNFAKEYNLFAMISVPIVSIAPDGKKNLIGVLNTYANRICDFTSLSLQLMQLIAEKSSVAIKKAKLIEQLGAIAKVDEKLTTTTEKNVLNDIADIARNLLDADQVVLYQYNSNIKDNFGFSTHDTVSGNFKCEKFKSQANFTQDSLVILLLNEPSNEFFIDSYENSKLIKRLYKNRTNPKSPKRYYEREDLKSVIILKLTFKKEVVGILFINYRYKKSFSYEEKRIAKTFASKAAIAISNIRKYEDIDRLHSVGKTIAGESDIEKVLEKIASNAKLTLKATSVILYRYDSNKREIIHPPILMGDLYFSNDAMDGHYNIENVQYRVIRYGRDVFAVNVKLNKIFGGGEDWVSGKKKISRFIERESIQSCAAVLLKVRRETVGVMFINYRTEQKFDLQQKRTIKIFANQAAIAIRNANLIKESMNTINRISTNINAIQKSGYAIVENLNKEQVSERDILIPTLNKALKLINVDMGYIGISDKEEKNTRIVVCSERYKKLLNKSLTRYYPDAEWIKRNDKFNIYPSEKKKSDYKRFADNPKFLSGSPGFVFKEDKNVQSALRVPIYSAKEFLGMIVIESEKLNAFSKIDAYAVMSLANQASMALQNYKLLGQLRKVRELSLEILREQSLDNVLKRILESALELVRKKYADIKLLMDNGNLIIKKSDPEGAEGKIIDVNQCLSGIAIKKKETHYEEDVSQN